MKRFATVVGLALVSACAGQRHAPPTEVAPAAAPSSPAATRASSAARTDPARHAPNPDSIVVPPAPSVDTRIDAEVAAELNVAADSAADAER